MTMNDWTNGEWTIKEASDLLGVSEKSIRRYIESERILAKKITGKFGGEWRVTSIPADLRRLPHRETRGDRSKGNSGSAGGASSNQLTPQVFMDVLSDKDHQIAELNQALGAMRLRISQLEQEKKQQILLLEAAKLPVPWWEKLFGLSH